MTSASVVSVSRDPEHRFSKEVVDDIVLIAGLGVEGDAHAGTTVQHRSRVARDPSQPNLRQVHLVHAELFDEVQDSGFEVAPGELGENVTTRGVDLLGLPRGAVLRLGPDAVVEVTGLRNPCVQIDGFEAGLMRELVTRDGTGQVVRKAGVMAVVLAGGRVAPDDEVVVELPDGEHEALQPV
ncbi:MOSC domain-containing protein [uncultured Frigoribacterium sp.]|uniref:MOSC domain-containing protein n=1 Tax=uncultured Frigoribacterium sp. TaxID=335377 RepID=UPI0028D64886|nr:MOSC domain-containing protein [uncultured Frigoribacterium sp.]